MELMDVQNGSYTEYVLTETADELNLRYANTLLPLATLFGVFCVLGISGNIVVLCVFSHSREYKTTNFKVFVIGIAIIDLLTCITLIPAEILKTRHYFSFSSPLPCKVKCFSNLFAMTSSALVLMVNGVDRYRKVRQPFKKQLSVRLAIACIVTMIVFSFVAAVPAAVMCGLQETNMTNIHKTLTTVTVCSAEDKYLDSKLRYAYKFGISLLLLCVSLALIVMYTLIIKTIAHHWKRRTNVSNNTNGQRPCVLVHNLISKEQQATLAVQFHRQQSSSSPNSHQKLPYKSIIWIILTLIFLVTFFINAGLSFLSTKALTFKPPTLLWYLIFYRLYFVNNVINPLIYALIDNRFKRSCKILLCQAGRLLHLN